MKIDAHVHIFPPEIRDNREKFFVGEPDFELLYASPKSRLVGAQELLSVMAEDGVDYSVVFGFPWRDIGISKLCNDYVIEQVKKHPDHLLGLACFGFSYFYLRGISIIYFELDFKGNNDHRCNCPCNYFST
jgi:hypothetical protein